MLLRHTLTHTHTHAPTQGQVVGKALRFHAKSLCNTEIDQEQHLLPKYAPLGYEHETQLLNLEV